MNVCCSRRSGCITFSCWAVALLLELSLLILEGVVWIRLPWCSVLSDLASVPSGADCLGKEQGTREQHRYSQLGAEGVTDT